MIEYLALNISSLLFPAYDEGDRTILFCLAETRNIQKHTE